MGLIDVATHIAVKLSVIAVKLSVPSFGRSAAAAPKVTVAPSAKADKTRCAVALKFPPVIINLFVSQPVCCFTGF
jgi:hypothetical protein